MKNYIGQKDLNAYWMATEKRFSPELTPVTKPDIDPMKISSKNEDQQTRLDL